MVRTLTPPSALKHEASASSAERPFLIYVSLACADAPAPLGIESSVPQFRRLADPCATTEMDFGTALPWRSAEGPPSPRSLLNTTGIRSTFGGGRSRLVVWVPLLRFWIAAPNPSLFSLPYPTGPVPCLETQSQLVKGLGCSGSHLNPALSTLFAWLSMLWPEMTGSFMSLLGRFKA